jgi:hypothetical protein
VRKHFFSDKQYILYLFQDAIIITQVVIMLWAGVILLEGGHEQPEVSVGSESF